MRKLLLPLIIIGVLIGSLFTLKDYFTNQQKDEEVHKIIEDEKYIDNLNLPLIEVDTLNPILTKNKQVADILKLIYEPLIDFDENNKLVPVLALEWNEKNELTWIIKLNKFARWHNGKEFSAEDVIFTYNSILQMEDSTYKDNIKNIISIEKIDTNTIQINLTKKDEYLLYKLTFPIISKNYYYNNLYNEIINNSPVGTGPYKYESTSEDNNIITLTANDIWWKNQDFKLKKIYLYKYMTYGEAIKAFKSTEIDVINTTMTTWQKKFGAIGINSYLYDSSEYELLIVNTTDKVLTENSVRRALLSAINAENIIESVYNGNGKVSNIPVQSNSYLNSNYENKSYDIEKAKKFLVNANWVNANGKWQKKIENKIYTLAFDLLVNSDNEEHLKVANSIIENLSEIDIKVKIIKVNSEEYKKRITNGKFELVLATLNLDMDTDIIELVESTSEKNFAKYINFDFDNIIKRINIYNIKEEYEEVFTLYKNEAPYIGLYYKCNNLLTNKSVKGNIKPTSWNPYHNIMNWCK